MKNKKNHLIHDWMVYIKVVEKKSFSAAAAEMGVSRGAVSKSVAKLEGVTNAQLLSRNAHKLEMTVDGKTVYKKALKFCETYHNLLARIDNNEMDGVLRLSAPAILCDSIISGWIMEYTEKNRNAKIHLLSREGASFSFDSPEFDDLVIKSGRMESPDLIHKNINPVPFGIYASPYYLKKFRMIETPEDLYGHQLLKLNHPSLNYPLSMKHQGIRKQFDLLSCKEFSSNNVRSLLHMALSGRGICVAAPQWSVQTFLCEGSLVEILGDWSLQPLPSYMVWRYRKWYSPLFKDFSLFLEEKWNDFFY
ncbi:LysR family transcriptional regulator [Pantoea ananatis]|uniref:LysR family transcriptional regulator n=1 Tax=Pantoea ananas TaxID=553 RepID=UPI0032EB245C